MSLDGFPDVCPKCGKDTCFGGENCAMTKGDSREPNPFEPDETPEQQLRRVGRMIRENADKRASESRGAREPRIIEDGFGSTAPEKCPDCGYKSMYVCRPGDIRCSHCYDGNPVTKKELQQRVRELETQVEKLQSNIALVNAPSFACGMIYGYDKPFIGGCGKPVLQHESYRCADCTASFHRDCIREHFQMDEAVKNIRAPECWRKDCAETKQSLETQLAEARQEIERLREELERHAAPRKDATK